MATARRNTESRGSRPKRDRPRYVPRRRVCAFCADKSKVIDFRDAARLRRYLSDRGKIESRRRTATCARHQRELATALKRARHLALLPFTIAHVRLSGAVGFRFPVGRVAPAPPPQERPPQEQAAQAPEAQAPAAQAATTEPPADQVPAEPAPSSP